MIWMATVANDHLRQLGVDSVRNRDEAVIRDEKITAYTVMVRAETVAKLEAVTALSAEQLGELGA